MAERNFLGLSRTQQRIDNKLGVIPADLASGPKLYRKESLNNYDSLYEMTQYEKLAEWEQSCKVDEYIPVRKRKPRLQVGYGRLLPMRVASKLCGERYFPTFEIEEDPDTQAFVSLVIKQAKLRAKLLEPVRRALTSGSCFVRFYFVEGAIKIEHYLSKYCYPEFGPIGELTEVMIKYVYEDPNELDQKGNPIKKWYRLDLGQLSDTLYDNPVFIKDQEPTFEVVSQVNHNFGFVQGEWFRTNEDKHSPDGESLLHGIEGFIAELDYSFSQSSTAVSYNQDPQLVLKGMDVDEIDEMVRSASKAWDLGRDGSAEFLETSLSGVERAIELRDKVKFQVEGLARVILLDPEKMVAHAQSGKAMEVLHGPMVDLIEELRPILEDSYASLVTKLVISHLGLMSQGIDTGLMIPAGWAPKSLNLVAKWPLIFPMTMEDLQKKVSIASSVTSANLLSRESMTRWLAKDFDIEDIEGEIQKIAAQPVINPFGGF